MTLVTTQMTEQAVAKAPAKAVAVPAAAGERELRLDLFRGIALWLIFIDHLMACIYWAVAKHEPDEDCASGWTP